MGVLPVDPIARIEVVRHGPLHYQLVGYTDTDPCWGWDYAGAYWTRSGAARAARRALSRSRVVVAEVT